MKSTTSLFKSGKLTLDKTVSSFKNSPSVKKKLEEGAEILNKAFAKDKVKTGGFGSMREDSRTHSVG